MNHGLFLVETVFGVFIGFTLTFILVNGININKDNNYESLMQEYNKEIEICESELNEIISIESQVKGYDYTKHLEKMSYRALIETYLPEVLKAVNGKKSPTVLTLDRLDYALNNVKHLNSIHENISSTKWWLNFSN